MSNKYLNDDHLQLLCDRVKYLETLICIVDGRVMKGLNSFTEEQLAADMREEIRTLNDEIFLLTTYLTG